MICFIGNSNTVEEDSNLIYKISGIAEFFESTEYCNTFSAVQGKASLAEEWYRQQYAASLAASMLELESILTPRDLLNLLENMLGEVNDCILGQTFSV